jgi:tol-pal system protein YbgF
MAIRLCLVFLIIAAMANTTQGASSKELEQKLNTMESRIERIEKLIDNKVLLEMLQRLEELQREVQFLRNDSERAMHGLDESNDRQRDLYVDIDRRLQALEVAGGTKTDTPPSSSERRGKDKPASIAASASPEAGASTEASKSSPSATTAEIDEKARNAYKRAFNQLKDRRYEHAIAAFNEFLAEYPQDDHASKAQYWLAEANYALRKFPVALVEFKKVITEYPNSSKYPDATLKIGFTYYELEDWENARTTLTELRNQYPNSTVARMAEQRLQRMKREEH